MRTTHHFDVSLEWTGNTGSGTSGYREYGRDLTVTSRAKTTIESSADRHFRGDESKWNPELLLIAALSECHALSYLHAAVRADVVVTAYTDAATGSLLVRPDGSGEITDVVLRPVVTVADATMAEAALAAHTEANRMCFIANSVSFPVRHQPQIVVTTAG